MGIYECCRGCRCIRWHLGLTQIGTRIILPDSQSVLIHVSREESSLADPDGRYAVYRHVSGITSAWRVWSCLILDRINRTPPKLVIGTETSATAPTTWDEANAIPSTGGAILVCSGGVLQVTSYVPTSVPELDSGVWTYLQFPGATAHLGMIQPVQVAYPQATLAAWCTRPGVLTKGDPYDISVSVEMGGWPVAEDALNRTVTFGNTRTGEGDEGWEPEPVSDPQYDYCDLYGPLLVNPSDTDERWDIRGRLYVPRSAANTPWFQATIEHQTRPVSTWVDQGTYYLRQTMSGTRTGGDVQAGRFGVTWRPQSQIGVTFWETLDLEWTQHSLPTSTGGRGVGSVTSVSIVT